MNIEENFNLKKLNTFRIDVQARYYIKCYTDHEIMRSINYGIKNNLPILCLGLGSNLLFTKNFEGLVIHIATKGIKIIEETQTEVYINVKSGENWHQLVLFCTKNGYGGIENLSLIPGSVGASPIQNLGAYQVEVKHVLVSLNAIKIELNDKVKYITFTNSECAFKYRDSYFQNEGKNNWIITDVTFKLTKKNHRIIDSYGMIQKILKKKVLSIQQS